MSETKVNTNEEVKDEEKKEEELLTPSEYFDKVKGLKHLANKEEFTDLYNTAMSKFKKYMITGQKTAARHLYNICSLAEREMNCIENGYDVFVYRKDVDTYIDNVADDCIVAIELENYEREIPDDIADKIMFCKENKLFDMYYIFFTDYTGEHRSKVEDKKRAKDPILFGACLMEGRVSDRLFFIGDWEDEFCHLTLDKMIEEMAREYTDGASMKRHATPILTLKEAEDILEGRTDDVLVSNKRNLPSTKSKKTIDGEAKPVKAKRGRPKKTEDTPKTPAKRGRKKKED
jgi:hypothetical protein